MVALFAEEKTLKQMKMPQLCWPSFSSDFDFDEHWVDKVDKDWPTIRWCAAMQEEKNVVLVAHYGAEVCMIFVAFISIGLLYEM